MSTLYNLVYVSTRHASCADKELQYILTKSRLHNHANDITGILLYSNNRFLQYLEGDKDTIWSLYKHIHNDKHHRQVALLYHNPIQERVFPSWQMGYRDLDAEQMNYKTQAAAADRELFQRLITQDAYKEIEGMHVLKLFFERA
ncbi:MAG: BLUF domain-containing protein [Aureispira sp.]